MKKLSLLIVTIQLGLAVAATAYEPTTIETAQGKTYERCKIIKHDPDGVSFTHSKGTAKVLFSDLSESMRNALGYDASKADAYEKEHAEALKEAALARRAREAKLAEAMIAQAKYNAQQPVVYMQQPNGSYMRSLAPVLGLGQIGVPHNTGFGGGHHGHGTSQSLGWSNPGNPGIIPGTGGVYVPQGNGTTFYGFPGVNYSPTLGYTNANSNTPVFFGQQSNGIVPGVAVPGSSTFPAHHH